MYKIVGTFRRQNHNMALRIFTYARPFVRLFYAILLDDRIYEHRCTLQSDVRIKKKKTLDNDWNTRYDDRSERVNDSEEMIHRKKKKNTERYHMASVWHACKQAKCVIFSFGWTCAQPERNAIFTQHVLYSCDNNGWHITQSSRINK